MGLLPADSDKDLMIGKNTPPALAVVLGIAGAINASLKVNPYDKPNVLFPNHFTKYVAIRSPNPVLTNPRAKKNEITINQMTSLVKALNAVVKVRVLVIMVVVSPNRAHAPTGNGESTSPAMVETKMERSCHACAVTSTGFGTTKRTSKPIAIESTKGTIFAPCNWVFFGSAIEVTVADDAEIGLRGFGREGKREGLEVVVVKGRRREFAAVGGGDRRSGLKVGKTWGRDLERIRDRRWREGAEKAVEKRAEASIANVEKEV